MRVRFWGVRGSTPTPQKENMGYGGNTSCIEIRTDNNEIMIFDGGTGIRLLGKELETEFGTTPIRAHIFFSHFHLDHIQGSAIFQATLQSRESFHVLLRRPPGCQSRHGCTGGDDGESVFPCRYVEPAVSA